LHSRPECRTVDGGDHWSREIDDFVEQCFECRSERVATTVGQPPDGTVGRGRQIRARTERTVARSTDHHHPEISVSGEHCAKVIAKSGAQRIASSGSVDQGPTDRSVPPPGDRAVRTHRSAQ
jgi:hypothetical protein